MHGNRAIEAIAVLVPGVVKQTYSRRYALTESVARKILSGDTAFAVGSFFAVQVCLHIAWRYGICPDSLCRAFGSESLCMGATMSFTQSWPHKGMRFLIQRPGTVNQSKCSYVQQCAGTRMSLDCNTAPPRFRWLTPRWPSDDLFHRSSIHQGGDLLKHREQTERSSKRSCYIMI